MQTKTWNGKTFREIQTMEEAKLFWDKLIIGKNIDNVVEGRSKVTSIKVFENNVIRLNKSSTEHLLKFYTLESGQPVGIEIETTFELPKLTPGEFVFSEAFNINETVLRIKKYIIENKIDGDGFWLSYNFDLNTWIANWRILGSDLINDFNFLTTYSEDAAETLCDLLNKNGVKL